MKMIWKFRSFLMLLLSVILVSFVLIDESLAATAIYETFEDGTSIGVPHGLSYENTPEGRGARFTRTSESRVQFPYSAGLPKSGTIEMLVKVDSAYFYNNRTLDADRSSALLFTTDVMGGDVTWPGSAWFYAGKNGDVSITIATSKYGSTPAQTLVASNTAFRFGEWHSVGFSYGATGQSLMVDGVQVATASANTTQLGSGGNHSTPVDTPTLGESVPGFWANNQYDGGFEGIVDTFRASTSPDDWTLVPNTPEGSYNLTATPASYNQINLDWSPISGAAIYALYRAESAAGPFTTPALYCGPNTDYPDDRNLSPNTTYYYRVVSGDATASCTKLAPGWATLSAPVSATTDPMPQDKISAGASLNMYNTHTSSDRLNIDIELAVNGIPSTYLCDQVNNGKFRIVNGSGAVVTADDGYSCQTPSYNDNFAKYKLQFRIKTVGARSAYFEDGKLQYCDTSGVCSDIENGPSGFSFYGTTFDVGKDAWKFENGTWTSVDSHSKIYSHAKIISGNLIQPDRRFFWNSMGWTAGDTVQKSAGLCYGLSNVAIAQFTNDESDWWGQGTIDSWQYEIDNHWDGFNGKALSPYKPLPSVEPISARGWSLPYAKKILYYFMAQPMWGTGTKSKWIHQDQLLYSVYDISHQSKWQELLKSGNPVSLAFAIDKDSGHAVTITSAIMWNDHVKYLIWDNVFPKDKSVKLGARYYSELYVHKYADNTTFFNSGGNKIVLLSLDGGEVKDQWTLLAMAETNFIGRDGDSQHIYHTDSAMPATPVSLSPAKSAAVPKSTDQAKQTEAIVSTGHIEVLVVGGAVTGVFDKDTGAKINLLSEGELTPGQAVQFIRLGGTMYKLYLPVDGQYRIEATKESSTPLLDIYVNIPNADGTLTSIGYDDQTYLENSVENVSFFVGRGNTDTNVRRLTKGTTYAPSATETVATAVGAPEYFTGMFTSENRVALTWENPVHPSFSKVQVVRKEDSEPSSPTDGTMVYEGTAQSFTDTGVTVGKYYFYSIYAVDTAAEYSEPQTIGIDTTRGNLSGYVKFGDGSGVANATVSLSKTTGEPVNSALTNSQGYFVISNVPFDAYVVSAGHPVNAIVEAPASVVIPDTATVNFTAIPKSVLMINKGGSGTGKVTSAPAGIDCGDDCSEVYAVGASVMLTATADPDYRFAGWGGDCSGTINPLSVTLGTNKSCIATFEKKFPWPMFLPGITRVRP